MTVFYLEFEKPLIELENRIDELKHLSSGNSLDVTEEIRKLSKKVEKLHNEIFSKLTSWQVVQLARHSGRPYFFDYLQRISTDFIELHGDRAFADDQSIIGGFCKINQFSCMVIGQQKGRNTKENMIRNFGMPKPEGYRKAMRLMKIADRFQKPIITFIDTPGAYPGIDAEERGQANAIAENLEGMMGLSVPIIAIVTGEGGSGGALAIGVANKVFMLQYSVYSVISPEACSSILFRDASKAELAAEQLHLSSKDALSLGVIDDIIPEPVGGAHRDYPAITQTVKEYILKNLESLSLLQPEEIITQRVEKFRVMGTFRELDTSM